MLRVLRPDPQPTLLHGHPVAVTQGQVNRQIFQANLQLRRTERQHDRLNASVAGMQHGGKACGNGNCRGHRAYAHRASGRQGITLQFLQQVGVLMQHQLGGSQHPLTLGCQTGEIAVTLDDDHIKFALQCTNGVAQRRLCDVTGLGCPPEVLVLLQRHQVAQ